MTFCGKSDASDLTFSDVPFHEEVVAFATDLCERINANAREHNRKLATRLAQRALAAAAAGHDSPRAKRAGAGAAKRAGAAAAAPAASAAAAAGVAGGRTPHVALGESKTDADVAVEGDEAELFAAAEFAMEPLAEYAIASEHQHSNLVLLAKTTYRVEEEEEEEEAEAQENVQGDGGGGGGGGGGEEQEEEQQQQQQQQQRKMKPARWLTWIDYDKFDELARRWREEGTPFSAMDYAAETPPWACFGCKERGMDPKEQRWFHNRTVKRAKAGMLSEQQMRQYGSWTPLEQAKMLEKKKEEEEDRRGGD